MLICIDFTAWLRFFTPHCMIKICRNQNSSQKKNTSEFTIPFSENTWNSIRSWIIMVATYLLGFKARLHQWEKIWLKAIKYQDMTFGSGRTWSANCWHGWYKDHTGCFRILSLCHSCPLPVLLSINEVHWHRRNLPMPHSFMCCAGLCLQGIVLVHKNTVQSS